MERTPIPDQQIKGLRVRDLAVLVICTASVVSTVIWWIASFRSGMTKLSNELQEIRNDRVSEAKYNELRFKTLETAVQAQQVQIDNLRNGQNVNRQRIDQFNK